MNARTFTNGVTLKVACLISSFLVALIVTDCLPERASIDAQVLAQSRGSNPAVVLTQSSCNAFNGLTACIGKFMNQTCFYCDQSTYTASNPGANGGYQVGGGTRSCGVEQGGICNAVNACMQNVVIGPCNRPPQIVAQP